MAPDTSPLTLESAIGVRRSALLRNLNSREKLSVLSACAGDWAATQIGDIAELLVEQAVTVENSGPANRAWAWLRVRLGGAPHKVVVARALEIVVRNWRRVPAASRSRVLERGGDLLKRAVAEALRSSDPALRAAAAEVAGEAGWLWAGESLAALVEDRERDVASAAEQSVVELSHVCAGVQGRPFRDALAYAVVRWPEHRRRGVLDAAIAALAPGVIALGGGGEALAQWFLGGTSESHMGMRGALKRAEGPLARLRAWQWLGRSVAAAAAMERLKKVSTIAEHEEVLRRGHLLANPVRAKRIGMLRGRAELAAMIPEAGTVARLSCEARRGVVRCAARSGATTEMKREALAPMLADSDATVRFAAAREVEPDEIVDYCYDAEPAVAQHATLTMIGRREGRVWRALRRSPHSFVRRIAEQERVSDDAWDPGNERFIAAARRDLAYDPELFVAEVRRRVREGVGEERVGAIMVARRLGLQQALELELLSIANSDADESVVATVVSALGEVESDSARGALAACLEHPTGRVRANAAEALLRAKRRRAVLADDGVRGRIGALKLDANHRVRANVLRGLARGDGVENVLAAEELTAMLADARPLHRLAALWAVERTMLGDPWTSASEGRWNRTASRVADLAKREPEAPVRDRAVRCAGMMLARMRAGWRGCAAEVGFGRGRGAA